MICTFGWKSPVELRKNQFIQSVWKDENCGTPHWQTRELGDRAVILFENRSERWLWNDPNLTKQVGRQAGRQACLQCSVFELVMNPMRTFRNLRRNYGFIFLSSLQASHFLQPLTFAHHIALSTTNEIRFSDFNNVQGYSFPPSWGDGYSATPNEMNQV